MYGQEPEELLREIQQGQETSRLIMNHPSPCKQVLLLITHRKPYLDLEKYRKLKAAFSPYGDVVLVCQENSPTCKGMADVEEATFTISDLGTLPYIALESSILPGSNHFILFWYYRRHPSYSHYWNVEYDVEYTGDWQDLFDRFAMSESDFLSSHIRDFRKEPEWYWWSAFFTKEERIPLEARIASFNPIYRLTSKAMRLLDAKLSSGWVGHHEVLIPTLLNWYGYRLEDFGGMGEYVKEENLNACYDETEPHPFGTMRHTPSFETSCIDRNRPLLYHPVKDK